MANLDDEENQIEEQPNEELTEKIAMELYIVVCKNGGVTDVTEARSALGAEGVSYLDKYGFFPLLKSSLRDVLKLEVEKPSNRAQLRALVKVELCTDYKKSKCESNDCPRLHVCPFFITDNCDYEGRCRYRHNFEDVHEQEILIKHKLNGLDHASLVIVLRRVIFGSNIQVCPQYKSTNGCPLGNACPKYHLCPWFVMGKCKKGTLCNRSHSLQIENTRIHSLRNLRRAAVGTMLSRVFAINQFCKIQPTVDEICGFHLKGNCQYGSRCNRHKHNLPYLWQIVISLEDGSEKWVDFPASYNQEIENDYCDVNKDSSIEIKTPMSETAEEQGIKLFIHFTDMVAKDDSETCLVRIRRLSTASWLLALPGDAYATRWTWYWTNDQNQWIPYDGGEANHTQERCDSSNEKLEESFLSGAETLTLPLNQNSYKIDLKNLQQTNTETGVSRRLRRRPTKFIGEQDLVDIASRANNRPLSSLPSTHRHIMLPSEWTTSVPTNEEVAFVLVDKSSNDYSQAEIEFRKTLSGNTIHKIERIQNVDLWESYSRKLSKLSRKLGSPPEVCRLFHGTSEDSAKAIGQQGFDWRLCGVHGTAYGKGSYFAVNASYSNGYTSNSQQGHKMMFLAKVIVGTYVVGNSSTVRPPPRNPIKPHELHDSCVDKQQNPTIFVIFDNDQAYPELLITYS